MCKPMRAIALSLFMSLVMLLLLASIARGETSTEIVLADDVELETTGVIGPDGMDYEQEQPSEGESDAPQADSAALEESAEVMSSEDEAETGNSTEADDAVLSAMASGSDIRYSGTVGTCDWTIDYDGNLVIRPSNGTSGSFDPTSYKYTGWKAHSDYVESVSFEGIVTVTTCAELFKNFDALSSVRLQGLDTSNVTDMHEMFYGCGKLEGIDLSSINTRAVTNMRSFLYNSDNVKWIKLGPDFRFPTANSSLALPYVSSLAPYKGLWAYESPISSKTYSSHDLPRLYDGATMAGTYVWAEYPNITQTQITLVASMPYTGDELKPEPTVKHGETTLVKGRDYELSYANNVNVGTATVTITGKGKYPGKTTKAFKIVRSTNGVKLPATLRVECADSAYIDAFAGSVKVAKWTTSNDQVAFIPSSWDDSAEIEGYRPGTAVITAIGGDGSKATCTVTVYAQKPKVKIDDIWYGDTEVKARLDVDEDLQYLYTDSTAKLKLAGKTYKAKVDWDGSIVFKKVKSAKAGKKAVLTFEKFGMTSTATAKVRSDRRKDATVSCGNLFKGGKRLKIKVHTYFGVIPGDKVIVKIGSKTYKKTYKGKRKSDASFTFKVKPAVAGQNIKVTFKSGCGKKLGTCQSRVWRGKYIHIGDTEAQVLQTYGFGYPRNINSSPYSEQWCYGSGGNSYYVYFRNGRVYSWQL